MNVPASPSTNLASLFVPLTALPIAVVVVDLDSEQIIFANNPAQHLFGDQQPSPHGTQSVESPPICPLDWQTLLSQRNKVEPVSHSRVQLKHQDGQAFEGDVSLAIEVIGGIHCLLATIQDVTEQTLLDAAYADQKREFAEAQRLSEIGSWRWDIAENKVFWSAELYRLAGWNPDQPVPNYEDQRKIYTDESYDVLTRLANACRSAQEPYEVILELRHPTEDRRWVMARGEPIIGSNGRVIALRGTLQNKTETVEAKIALEIKAAETEELKRRAEAFVQNASDGFHVLTPDGILVEASDSFCQMLGYDRHDLIGQHVSSWDAQYSPDGLAALVKSQFASDKIVRFDSRHRRCDGTEFDVEITGKSIELSGNLLLLNSSRDISGRKATERQLRLSATVFNAANEAITVTDANNNMLQVNEAFERITGYSAAEAIGKNPSILSSGRQPKEFYQKMWTALIRDGRWSGEIWNRRKTGEFFPEWLSVTRLCDEHGNPENHIAIFTDITEQKAAEETIHQLAYNDPLTGLPNRRMMLDRIQNEADRCSRNNSRVAILYIDLDLFKNVNDHHGHLVGDELLILVASRLRESVRRNDIVGRLGGDEFLVILTDLKETGFAAVVAETIIARLAAPFFIHGVEVSISASIGVAVCPDDAGGVAEVLKFADIAMYEAKQKGRNTYLYFSDKMNSHVARRMELNNALRSAILHQELKLAYQPQIDLETSRLVGMEALLRWTRPSGEIISPIEFIPIAEESGLIVRIGEWVIDQVCGQVKQWRAQGLNPPNVAINVSAVQIERSNIAEIVQSILAKYDLEPSAIVIEITESVMMKFAGESADPFQKLIAVGAEIAIDDFGTGYSSLAYLTHLQVAKLKIDRAFVKDITTRKEDRTIVGAVTSMAKQLGMQTVAEGIETAEQAALLRQLDVDIGQGYFWSKPIWESEMHQWLINELAHSETTSKEI
jgi:diguanylate cyclase (GGDEF)-like protein/PAS domain S-box-containing protein